MADLGGERDVQKVLAKIMPNNWLAVSLGLAPPLGNPGVATVVHRKVTKILHKTLSG